MPKRPDQNRPRKPREVEEGAPEKVRVPAEGAPQRPPGQPPIGNGGTEEPAAFPEHN